MESSFTPCIRVLHGGLHCAVQDMGRMGYGHLGVSRGGVLDTKSAKLANWLVGNDEHLALVEITMQGPKLLFEADSVVALVGAPFDIRLNGASVPMGEALHVAAGAELAIGLALHDGPGASGLRCYLALDGGIAEPAVLGSLSTNFKAGFGGHQGRTLKAGDVVAKGEYLGHEPFAYVGNRLPEHLMVLNPAPVLRVIPSHYRQHFKEEGYQLFYNEPYRLTNQCDRMGLRLSGPTIEYNVPAFSADIVSEPNAVGSIQIPGDGQPLILMADCGTTGGYAKIGTIISADLHNLGQAKPGDDLRFVAISLEEAKALMIQSKTDEDNIKEQLLAYKESTLSKQGRWFGVTVGTNRFQVHVFG